MARVPAVSGQFAHWVQSLFPGDDAPAVALRSLTRVGGSTISVVYLADLADPAQLGVSVVDPLLCRGPITAPEQLTFLGGE